jgi:hypothetical protein
MTEIMTIQQINKYAVEIQEFLDNFDTSIDIPDMIFERGNQLASYVSTTGKMKADSKYHLLEATRSGIFAHIEHLSKETGMSATAQKELINSLTASGQRLNQWCDRLNATATHQLEWCRSMLSYIKADMNASFGVKNTK